ncbi:Nitrilase/cyanide hydratase and apolipoprotein N-acyltransferase [Streptomyces clavuligerus]|uniref:Nitrilase/cyanide hydratase and apolipoprotein N-acyltransferase n=2 Tax=Streptomyces clavuligerus TaxID=1901 RepID=E2PUF3_STRCL|nr:Nitrilase/cyanide hydratase and apolipoprotein N-acyltransferase [Streptomyces clavuligerus]
MASGPRGCPGPVAPAPACLAIAMQHTTDTGRCGRIRTLATMRADTETTPAPGAPDGPDGSGDLLGLGPEYLAFWREYHLCTLTTQRPDGSPHLVPVGVTFEPETGTARVITNRNSRKVANILRSTDEGGARVAVCQVDRGRWATLEGRARIRTEEAVVADAVRRYAERYGRTPGPNPDRVVIEIAVRRALGRGAGISRAS